LFLTAENYYSNEANLYYMSVSQYKSFISCEAKALAELIGYRRKSTKALLVGSYVDAWCEGTLTEFQENNPEIFSKKSKSEKVLLKDFQEAEDIIEVIKSDVMLMSKLSGEKQVILTANLFGVPWKIKMDNYNPEEGFFSDLKVMANISNKIYNKQSSSFENFIQYYKYNYQMCIYSLVEKKASNRKKHLESYIVAVTKESPPDKGIFTGFIDDLEEIEDELETNLPRIIDLKSKKEEPVGCGECEYCRSIKNVKIKNYHEI